MTVLYMAFTTIGYLWAFWYLYVLVMAFYRASLAGRLTGVAKWLAMPAVLIAVTVDLLANWTIAALWFRSWPVKTAWPRLVFSGWKPPTFVWVRPDLVTDRLSRYITSQTGWRKDQATWLCENLLDYFDPSGVHCKE